MAPLSWSKIPTVHLPRSSHSVNIMNGKAYVFGGELQPRQPVDNAVHVINLSDGSYEILPPKVRAPCARVGHTTVVIDDGLYMFGGRGGEAMTPLEERGAVWRFRPASGLWTLICPLYEEPYPQARSYHCSTATTSHIIVHAGCGDAASGRLADTWAFDIVKEAWTRLADAPGAGRGGVALAHLGGKLYRFGGFNGTSEQGGGLDVLDLSSALVYTDIGSDQVERAWEHIPFPSSSGQAIASSGMAPSGPGARSVSALLPFSHQGKDKLLLLFGEGKPSPTGGHDAAGKFYDDVWAFDPASQTWEEVPQEGDGPGARGWFGADASGEGVVVWGGLNDANEREGDGWVLKAE